MPLAHIALGANLGDRLAALRAAADALGDIGRVAARSSVYETAAVGPPPDYLNAAVALDTPLAPRALLDALLAIEHRFGRVRTLEQGPSAPRPLDLDLLLYGDEVVDEPTLLVPHPRLHQRSFVLVPLAEIAPDAMHPLLHRTIADLLASLEHPTPVRRLARL